MKVVIIESNLPNVATEKWDERVIALSPASQQFLNELGIWKHLAQDRLQAVNGMEIFGDDGSSSLAFSSYECAVDRMATIVEAGAVHRALWEAIRMAPDITLLCPASAGDISWSKQSVEIRLANGDSIISKLVVGADGMHSAVRAAAGVQARIEPAGQLAVVANFSCELPHRGIAYQWFRGDGVLAWLPLPGRLLSMVWSTDEGRAEELLRIGPDELCNRVGDAGRNLLGDLQPVSGPAAFALSWLSVKTRVRERLALIGDAGHVVHPLAGQGINLGLGDARQLALYLRRAGSCGADPGALLHLRKFERSRAEGILAMQLATKGLKRLFEDPSLPLAKVRNIGLNLVDRTIFLKSMLARQAMG